LVAVAVGYMVIDTWLGCFIIGYYAFRHTTSMGSIYSFTTTIPANNSLIGSIHTDT